MAELEYRSAPKSEQSKILARLKNVVMATAAFVADFPDWNNQTQSFDLGPPIRSAPEGNENPNQVWNPTYVKSVSVSDFFHLKMTISSPNVLDPWENRYEIQQFNFSLDIANLWRERLGLDRNTEWDYIRKNLSPSPIVEVDGERIYNGNGNCQPNIWTEGATNCDPLTNHPAFLGAMGAIPGISYLTYFRSENLLLFLYCYFNVTVYSTPNS